MSNYLSQNKKIALSAIAIFMVSFAFMLYFLDGKVLDEKSQGANVFESTESGKGIAPTTEEKEKSGIKETDQAEKNEQPDVDQEDEPKKEKKHNWMENIYPKIKELEDGDSGRLMVDKVI